MPSISQLKINENEEAFGKKNWDEKIQIKKWAKEFVIILKKSTLPSMSQLRINENEEVFGKKQLRQKDW